MKTVENKHEIIKNIQFIWSQRNKCTDVESYFIEVHAI